MASVVPRSNGLVNWARSAVRLISLTLFLVLALSPVTAAAHITSPALHGPRLPRTGALFGASVAVGTRTGPSKWQAVASFEDLIGRKESIDRESYAWDQIFPSPDDYLSRDLGRTLIFDWNTPGLNGRIIKWADIASGVYDSDIDNRAEGLIAFGAPAFFVFQHEPENNVGSSGTAQDFINAYRHVHDRFLADGVTNVSFAEVLMAYTFRQGTAEQFYPGSGYVDLIGADGYNWYSCPGRNDPWTWFSDVFDDFYSYGLGKGKPMMIVEFGSMEDPVTPGRKALWLTKAAATLKTWPQIKAIAYFDHGEPDSCDWWVDTSVSSLASYTAIGADPYFNPPQPPPPDSSTAAYVGVWDNEYGNPAGYPTQGMGVTWLFSGNRTHSVTDNSGMGLFDSGSQTMGALYTFKLVAAGNYNIYCTIHPSMTATIRVPLLITPLSGNLNTTFTVQWADGRPPSGYVYDVQIQRPGSSDWETWKDGVTSASAAFKADSGRGTYSFRSRITNVGNGESSWYSEDTSIDVR